MKWSTKLLVHGTTALWGVLFGFGAGAAISALAMEKLGGHSAIPFECGGVGGAVIGVLMFRRSQQKAIQESRHRLSSESYKQTLLRLGIATGPISNMKGSYGKGALLATKNGYPHNLPLRGDGHIRGFRQEDEQLISLARHC